MKRINMAKYGFIRDIAKDFSDDGSRFLTYLTSPDSRLRITKHVSDGKVYLSVDMRGNKLDYEEYKSLPHFHKATWDYNGVSIASLTDEDLVDFYNACVNYEKEYIEAESKITFPTIEEIRKQCEKINTLRRQELTHIDRVLADKAATFILSASNYELKCFKDYYKNLSDKAKGFDLDTYPQTVQQTAYGNRFVRDNNPDLKHDYYYCYLLELLMKY